MRRFRYVFLAGILAGAFVYLTTQARLPRRFFRSTSAEANQQLWSGPKVAQSAGLSQDELNNIDVYKTSNRATVNITSTVYRRNFWLDIIPAKETGSGFLID